MTPENLDALGEQIATDVAHIDAALHRVLTMLRAFDEAGGWLKQGARSCSQWLSWRVSWSPSAARDHVRVANALGKLPKIDDALRLGKLSYSKVRAITRVATPENEHVLLEQALLTTGHQLEQICRKYAAVRAAEGIGRDLRPSDDLDRRYVRRRELADGMVIIEARLHPEESAIVWAALERVATERCRSRGEVDASAEAPAHVAKSAELAVVARDDEHVVSAAVPDGASAEAAAHAPSTDIDFATAAGGRHVADAVAGERNDVHVITTAVPHGASAEAADAPSTDIDFATAADGRHLADAVAGACDDVPVITTATPGGASAEAAAHAPSTDIALATAADGRHVADAVAGACDDVPVITTAMPGGASAEARITPAFDRADALVAMAEAVLRGDRPQRSPTELVISVPVEALHAHGSDDVSSVACCRDGTPLSPAVVRRLACDAGLVTVIEDARGNALDVGRKQRTISGALKRALLRRDQTCRFPGCTTRVFLEGHHIEHWANGGKTELSNAICLCGHHHRFVHEYGFTIELGEDGAVTAYRPDGRVVRDVPARMQLAGLGWPTIESRNAPLGITADTIGTWDGTPADYVELVDALVRADALLFASAAPA